jgi:hypothetical protein
MRRSQVGRLLRQAGKITKESEFFLIGSQAVHAVMSRPPAEVLLSRECDLYPKNRPEVADLIHRELGPASRYARTEGFYADVVTPKLATLPAGWESRLKRLRLGPVTAWCLELHDLVVSKLAAGRLKDLEFAAALLALGFVQRPVLSRRISRLASRIEADRIRSRLEVVLDDLRSTREPTKVRPRR